MENRFKFRCWNKMAKVLKECSQLTLASEQTGSMSVDKTKCTVHLHFQPSMIVMQCTGMKDKNGTLIFEGDIVYKKGAKKWNGEKLLSKVIWDEQDARFMILDDNGIHNIPRNSANIEIVGNIYENLNLLEEKCLN